MVMCGIIGAIGEDCKEIVANGLKVMKNRGKDNSSSWFSKEIGVALGHNLHSIVSYVEQPLFSSDKEKRFIFAANCEIYNWKELSEKYKIKADNDAVLLFELFLQKGVKCLTELDGVYAFFLYDSKEKKLILARDILGVKPLFYLHDKRNNFCFASEKKSLPKGLVQELNPRQVLTYVVDSDEALFEDREFFKIGNIDVSKSKIVYELEEKFTSAIMKRIPDKKFGLLFSGGVDSTLIAYIMKKKGLKFTCYTAAISDIGESEDLVYAKKIAKEFDLDLKIATITLAELEDYIKKVAPLIESNNVVKVGVALPFFLACEAARKDKLKVIFSGLGSEELFAGYERHAVSAGVSIRGEEYLDKMNAYDTLSMDNVNKECLSGLMQIHERDLYRDDVVTMFNEMELRLPFLDKKLIEFALKIPPKFKISAVEKKIILRDMAEKIGLPTEYARRPKKAAQYGSKFDKGIEKLAKVQHKTKSEYLKQFYDEKNLRLGALLSTGKDSVYATIVMQKQNYDISCFMTMKSKNDYSFMFHTPNTKLAKLQAEACGIPLLVQETLGEKEDELTDLVLLLKKAKKEFKIDGVVTGAIFSTYQRDRIEKACDKVGLVCFSPLWHKDQEKYMYELLENDVHFIMSSVASEGLDEKWVGREIEAIEVARLVALNKKTGMNVAGEGGEFETFVFDCSLFKKKISIVKGVKVFDPERNENVKFDIVDAKLVDKD